MTTTFTKDQVITALEEAAAGKPENFRYLDKNDYCTYTNDEGQPNCIAGDALARMGVPHEVLITLDMIDEDGLPYDSDPVDSLDVHTKLYENGYIILDNEVARILRRAQFRQDSGKTHAEAVLNLKDEDVPEDEYIAYSA